MGERTYWGMDRRRSPRRFVGWAASTFILSEAAQPATAQDLSVGGLGVDVRAWPAHLPLPRKGGLGQAKLTFYGEDAVLAPVELVHVEAEPSHRGRLRLGLRFVHLSPSSLARVHQVLEALAACEPSSAPEVALFLSDEALVAS